MQEAEPKTVTESTEAQKKIRDFLWAAETAERAASLSKNIDWRLEKLAEEGAKIDITSPILLNDEELPPDQRADIINSIKKNRAELIKRFGVNLILKSEYEKDPGAYDTSRMIVLSRTIIKGAENARYLDITTISGEDAFLNIANVLTIAKGFLCCVVTQHPDLKVRLINFLRRNGIQAAEGELEDLLERFIAEPGFMLKLQLPSPKPVTRGYFNELHRLMSQVFIAA